MPKQYRNSRKAAYRSNPDATQFLDLCPIFEPLEHRRLLATIGFENLSVGNLGSGGYTDSAGYKFVNLPGSGGTSVALRPIGGEQLQSDPPKDGSSWSGAAGTYRR